MVERVETNQNMTYDELMSSINECLVSASSERQTFHRKRPSQPFWDLELTAAVNDMKEKFKEWRRSSYHRDSHNAYLAAEKKFKTMLKRKKQESWRNLCESWDSQTALSKMWNMAKIFKGNYRKSSQLRNEDLLYKVLENLAPPSTPEPPLRDLQYEARDVITSADIQVSLLGCQNSSPGVDQISYEIIKQLPPIAKDCLATIYNRIIIEGVIPQAWKFFKIIPILKPEKDPNDAKSYRPIALACCFRKLFEIIIKEKLEWYIESAGLFHKEICGFRKGCSTMDAIHAVVEQARTAISLNEYTFIACLDIQSAYDKVNMSSLVDEMNKLGINSWLIRTVHSLMSERFLVASVDPQRNLCRTTWQGLPQGSPLSPICFNIYMVGLLDKVKQVVPLVCFADDVTLYYRDKNPTRAVEKLQSGLNVMHDGLHDLGLTLSPSKCSAMICCRRKPRSVLNLEIQRTVIKYENVIKLLGVFLTPRLSWAAHIRHLVRKTTPYVNFLRSIAGQRWGADPAAMLTVYRSCVRACLEYGSLFYCEAKESILLPLDRVQWKCLRICLGATRTCHTGSLEVIAGIMPLKLRRRITAEQFVARKLPIRSWYELYAVDVLENRNPQTMIHKAILRVHDLCPTAKLSDYLGIYMFADSVRKYEIRIDCVAKELIQNPMPPQENVCAIVEKYLEDKYSDHNILATDGSQTEHGTGYAVAFYYEQLSIKIKLPDYCTVFNAEILAIREGISCISNLPPGKYLLLSDSMSALLFLANRRSRAYLPEVWFLIREHLSQLERSGYEVTLMWVPSHQGITMNEKADQLAKEATEDGNSTAYTFSHYDISFPSERRQLGVWQQSWNSGSKGRYCFSIFPKVRTSPRWSGEN